MTRRIAHAYAQVRRWTLLTDLGVLVALAGFVLLRFYGLPRSDFVAQMAGAGALGLVALGLISVLFGVVVHALDGVGGTGAVGDPLAFEAWRGHAAGPPWPVFFWPLVDANVRILAPEGLETSRQGRKERLSGRHRAAATGLERAIVIEDAFGLVRAELRRQERRTVLVSPYLGALDGAPALTALAPGETRGHPLGRPAGDRVEMRPYVPGDPLRLVLWKIYARTGGLYVRTPERALDEEVEVHAHLVAGPGDEPSAASAWVAITRGHLGPRWSFGADGTSERTSEVGAAQSMIAASRRARRCGGQLEAVLSQTQKNAGTRLVLFVPCRLGPWLSTTAASMRPVADRSTIVVGHDRPLDAASGRSWLRAEPRGGEGRDGRPTPAELDEIVQTFARLGAVVIRVDRETGRSRGAEAARSAA
ncbi:MAG: DUF58 domain-containing protein [Myxococcota bacterium]